MEGMMRRVLLVVVVVFVLMQLVPLDRSNPPATGAIEAPDEVRTVLETSCFDCHSYATDWPWYAWVAPVSYLVVHDVDEAREHLNFSAWTRYDGSERRKLAEEILDETHEGEMPLAMYTLMHPGTKLSADDQAVLDAYFGAMATGAWPAEPPPAVSGTDEGGVGSGR
jgi:hypothetical protein